MTTDRVPRKARGVFEKMPGSGIWWICYHDAQGRRRREKVGRKSAAIKLYHKRKTQASEGRKLPENLRARAVLFSVLAEDALEYSEHHKLSYKTDKWRMGLLKKAFGDKPADSITPQEIERWITEHEDWKPATVNRYRALISLAYRLGAKNKKVDANVNPARLVEHQEENNGRVRFLSKEEEKALREKIEVDAAEHLPELELALNTGLRRSEQYRLTWDCVSFEKRLLTILQSKNGEPRHIPLNSAALSALAALRRRRGAGDRVFVNQHGEPLLGPRHWFEPAVRGAGLADFTWHCLRHTFASRLVMAGVDIRTVQELMGHKSIQMTCRYAHLAPSHKLAAVEKLTEGKGVTESPTATKTATGQPSESEQAPAVIN